MMVAVSTFSTASDEVEDQHGRITRLAASGIAPPGSGVHAWISAHAKGARSDTPIRYGFTFREGGSNGIMADVHQYDETSQARTSTAFGAPPPPGFSAPVPGATNTTSVCGYTISFGSTPGTADMQFKWEWRNTRDTHGDGEMDADPDWVLVDYRASDIELGTSELPLQC
jgi:hypothetical protein